MSQLLPLLLALACPLGMVAMMAAPAVARLFRRPAASTSAAAAGASNVDEPADAPLPGPAVGIDGGAPAPRAQLAADGTAR